MRGAVLVKWWREVHPLGQILTVCAAAVVACLLWFVAFFHSMKNEPDQKQAQKTLRAIQRGQLKPDRAGLVVTENHTIYVTRAAGKLTVLWPYNLAHDDNYFEGLLFSDMAVTSNRLIALGPTRGGYLNAPQSFLTHLIVDRKLSEHWYHVQGKMYK